MLEDAWADFCRFKDSGDKLRNPKILADQQRKFDFMRLYWGNRDVLSITKKNIKALLQRYLILYVFHQVLVDQGIVPENKHGERKVFHSLRHTFVTKVLASGVSLGLL
ncbi:hypothetical protein AYI77_18695 [Shewanella algae]|nr:hypothetical protein AYI77_18695 [Shewanella algae]